MIDDHELKALCDRIIKSGELGRSRTYAAILLYLADQVITGIAPKEISIAMDVLGRDSDFDVGKDSIVRVHIYHLRTKLNTYFARQGRNEKFRIDIPKGQYMLAISENQPVTAAEPELDPGIAAASVATGASITGAPLARRNHTLLMAAVALLIWLVIWFTQREQAPSATPAASNPFAATVLWQPLLDDSTPILVLVGDYYIMGEGGGIVERMVREFGINSPAELSAAQAAGAAQQYVNLDLSYTPTSIPYAVAEIMKVLGSTGSRVTVKMMSEVSTNDLVGQHVIYLGYLSGMQRLTDLMFADSGLAFGATYDELINLDTDALYSSSSGLSIGEDSYRDYGMLSTFPAPGGTQYLLFAGMRDEGLLSLLGQTTAVDKLMALAAAEPNNVGAFEALYEVRGFDNTNFDTTLVYHKTLDTTVVWETRLLGQP